MHDLPLLVAIAVALAYALVGGLLARRVGLPTIVGYLVAGVALGPFTPGFHGDETAIRQFSEFGVILLMFGVGLHFSFRDLWQVRRVAIPGAILQMVIISVIGYGLGRYWGFSSAGAWVLGIAFSVASTVVLMRGLMDQGWLDTPHGKVVIGWLVFEDLLTVAVLVLLPILAAPDGGGSWVTGAFAFGKVALFIGLMLVVGKYVLPFLLNRVVHTRSRELFVLVALTVAVGTALASAALFDVSLALGAFVAGVVVSESPFSHQIGADLLPFREAFAVIFFVSVGMLVNPQYVLDHWGQVLIASFVIIVVKGLVSGLLGVVLPGPARTALVLAAGRSQIGEFSFIVGQTGIAMGAIDSTQYSLILAGAMVSITANAGILKLVEPAERALKKWPLVWRALNHGELNLSTAPDHMTGHVVIVGCGRVGRHIAEALGRLKIPRLVVEVDPTRLVKLAELGVPVLFGDAANSEILDHAAVESARALVVTLADDSAAQAVVAAVRRRAPDLRIVARASSWDAARRMTKTGANHVVRPELEGGIEIVRRTLLDLDLPLPDVQRYTELIRRDGLDESVRPSADQARVLDDLVGASRGLEVVWLDLESTSPLAGHTLAASAMRTRTGASVVAIGRGGSVIPNPAPDQDLSVGDRLALIGTPTQVAAAEALVSGGGPR